ncbi:hypothetical protein N8T08_007723 [Aspergillus melleus]|uniref:Uncharacterized protein n=1 Tax=Aspergillus melleus TaxID=138277 RepID=A0ACC3BEG1_9EURO|nr:hypothetical protein N8T08_007723 [Aspergillus melleus]
MQPEFHRYLVAVESGHRLDEDLANWERHTLFKTAFRQQQEIVHRRQPGQRHGEPVVNTSLITFLQSIKELIPEATKHWVRQFVAITDGHLMDWVDEVRGVVECKRGLRNNHFPQVDKQEGAHFAAWSNERPDGPGNRRSWRVLVSQDGPELYVSFLEYGPAWEEYITKNRVGNVFPVPAANLATIRTYGAWKIDIAQDMLDFARIIVAILLHP